MEEYKKSKEIGLCNKDSADSLKVNKQKKPILVIREDFERWIVLQIRLNTLTRQPSAINIKFGGANR